MPELSRYQLPDASWPGAAEPGPPWDGSSLAIGAEPTHAAAAQQAPTGPALNELLARLQSGGLTLDEPASLFPGSVDPATKPVPAEADEPISLFSSRPDSGLTASAIPRGALDTFSGRDKQPEVGLAGSAPGLGSGSGMFSSEMIGELASRLLGAAERLEQAALRITQPAPGSLTALPRPFRGRVDG